MKYFI